MTVSKSCIDVLRDLGEAFSDAIRPEGLYKPEVVAPYIVENETGFDITLNFKKGVFNLHSSHLPNSEGNISDSHKTGVVFKSSTTDLSPNEIMSCTISPNCRAYLQCKKENALTHISAFNTLDNEANVEESHLYVQVSLNSSQCCTRMACRKFMMCMFHFRLVTLI